VSLGTPLTLTVREVVCEVSTPSDIVCGEGFDCSFRLHYSLSDSAAAEKEIRIISDALGGDTSALRPRKTMSRILKSLPRSQSLTRAFLRRVVAIRMAAPETASLMVLALAGVPKIARDSDELELEVEEVAFEPASPAPTPVVASAAGAAAATPSHRRPKPTHAVVAEVAPPPPVNTRVWAGLFMLEAVASKWRRVAMLLAILSRARAGGAAIKAAVDAKLHANAEIGDDSEAAHQPASVALRPPRLPPYDPKVPVESYWLPRLRKGVIRFGSSSRGIGGHPLYPGIYQVGATAILSARWRRCSAAENAPPPPHPFPTLPCFCLPRRCACTRAIQASSRL
jgi:hypothetical protein